MDANSRIVTSNQTGIHSKLIETLERHLEKPFRRPYARHSLAGFQALEKQLARNSKPLIFDSFCGTGHSTATLATNHPDCFVIGIDQSQVRLDKHPESKCDNYYLLHGDTDDIWRLALEAGWHLQQHTILYPNPWPKSRHMQRRVQGSALFPTLLALGGQLEVRSNWQLYIEELGAVFEHLSIPHTISQIMDEKPVTLFEKKYRDSGHVLWKIRAQLSNSENVQS